MIVQLTSVVLVMVPWMDMSLPNTRSDSLICDWGGCWRRWQWASVVLVNRQRMRGDEKVTMFIDYNTSIPTDSSRRTSLRLSYEYYRFEVSGKAITQFMIWTGSLVRQGRFVQIGFYNTAQITSQRIRPCVRQIMSIHAHHQKTEVKLNDIGSFQVLGVRQCDGNMEQQFKFTEQSDAEPELHDKTSGNSSTQTASSSIGRNENQSIWRHPCRVHARSWMWCSEENSRHGKLWPHYLHGVSW